MLGLLLCVAVAAQAAERAIPAAADNTLFEDPFGSISNGAGPHFYVGPAGPGIRRGLIRFDLAPTLPVGSTVNTAELRLNLNRPLFSPWEPLQIHRLLASWGEGGSNAGEPGGGGAPATTGDATWLHRFWNTQTWASPGGDFAESPSAATTPTQLGPVAFTGDFVRDDVQAWHDGAAANHGWLVKLTDESGLRTAHRFDSREGLAGPTLLVSFRAGGDATNDDRVNIADFSILGANFNQPLSGPDNADFNRNGTVEIGDFSILAANFNLDLNPPGARGAIPEPNGIAIALALAAAHRRRRYP